MAINARFLKKFPVITHRRERFQAANETTLPLPALLERLRRLDVPAP
jgi:hypothetical protein